MKQINLIGIVGKIYSGKSTVSSIITTILNKDEGLSGAESWKVEKYAGKLKDIVCILIDCTREDLEHHEFKNKKLDSSWDRWLVVNRLSNSTIKIYSTEQEAIQYIKDIETNVSILEEFRPSLVLGVKKQEMTPRLLMQLIGTDCFRDIIHPNTWVNSLFNKYTKDSKWVIDDVRFNNEYEAITKNEGIIIRVNRDIDHDSHRSETELDNNKADYTIYNNGSIEDLTKQVNSILLDLNLI